MRNLAASFAVAVSVAALLLVAPASAQQGQCSQWTDCASCVSHNLCGWCSYPTIIPGSNASGPQCVGFGPGAKPFICPAIYSTEQCVAGYLCDSATGTCYVGPPGQGQSKQQCEQACSAVSPSPHAQVYGCNPATKQCTPVPSGTPGSASYQICMAQCQHVPTPAPGPIAPVYLCNVTTWTCEPCQPGHGASQMVCEQTCNSKYVGYVCDRGAAQCRQVPPGTGGIPYSSCEKICGNSTDTPLPTLPPNPGPPPEYIGTWRGIEIQNGYKRVEWDMKVNHTDVIITEDRQSGIIRWRGTPYHIDNSDRLQFWILLTSGPGAGSYLYTIGDTSGENGPQTSFATMAMSPPGGVTPTSIDDSMTNGIDKVFAWTKCIIDNPYCHFSLPVGAIHSEKQKKSSLHDDARMPIVKSLAAASSNKKKVDAKFYDKCSQYGEACSVCLQHQDCGWCSVDVQYSDGQTGTQCAGFQGNTSFVCQGRYSTTSCEVGYICTSGSFQCIPTQPGDGMPQGVCLATCKPTPPPNPKVTQYVCNLATHQCSLCRQAHCPGSMPKEQCATLCQNPMPGPTPAMTGVWRGIYIEDSSPHAEVDLIMNVSGAYFYVNSVLFFDAAITSLGADVQLWAIRSGPMAGETIGVLYQMAMTYYGMYWQGTFALGIPNHGFPTDYNTPMYTLGEKELVLAKCLKAPCEFNYV